MMKHLLTKHFLFLFLSFLSFTTLAQEQITNIIGAGSTARYILREYDGEKYIMTTLPFDSLRVYKLVNGAASYQYSRKFDGIYAMSSYRTTDQFLLLSNGNGSIAYNFTDNTMLEVPYEGLLSYTSWYSSQALGDEIILKQSTKDFTESRQFLYNLSSGQHQILRDDLYFLKLGVEKLYAYTYTSDTTYQIYVLDKESLSIIDSTTTPILNGGQYFFDGEDYLVYAQKNNIKRYNFQSGDHELVLTIESPFRSMKISQSDDEYVIDVDNLSTHNMIRVHSETFESSQFLIENEYESPSPDILYGKYLIFGSNLVTIDTSTGVKVMFPSLSRKGGNAILESRYIIYYNNSQHFMLDLATMQNYVLAQMPIPTYARNMEVMYENGIYLLNFDNISGNNKKLFEVNLTTKMGVYSSKITGTSEGLIKDSKLIKVKNDVILVNSENIYLVKGNTTTKLNTHPLTKIRHTDFKIANDVLYWCEYVNGEYNIYKLQDETAVKIASIPNLIGLPPYGFINLYDYVVTPNAIIVSSFGFDDKQFRYDLQTNQFVQISTVESSEYFGFYYEGDYYYTADKKIVILKSDGSTKSINVSAKPNFFGPFLTYKNRLFYGDRNGFFEIIDDNLTLIVDLDDAVIVTFNVYKGYILISDYPNDYLYDGTSTFHLINNYNQYRGENILDDYFVMYEGVGTNTTVASLVNFKTNTSITLPAEVANLNNIRLFRNAEKYVLMGSGGFSPFNKVVLFETDKNFTFFTKIKEFDVTSRGLISSFTEYTNEGFLYTGNTMYLMDTLLNFVPIEGLIGENQSSTVFEQDGYFYFVAIHPINGRQLFRIQPFSLRTSVEDDNTVFTKLNIYPNPSSQEIYFGEDAYSHAEVYHISGTKVLQSPIGQDNRLDISSFANGAYVVILTSDTGSKSVGKFIKVD